METIFVHDFLDYARCLSAASQFDSCGFWVLVARHEGINEEF